MKKSELRKIIKEEISNTLSEDKSQMKELMQGLLGEFFQFVVTMEETLDKQYDNYGDKTILRELKETMIESMDQYVEFLEVIDEKTKD
tara:strand:+ start:292 stop:555 length:264 start_codon:yes stop_codon:yes gene_type:complete